MYSISLVKTETRLLHILLNISNVACLIKSKNVFNVMQKYAKVLLATKSFNTFLQTFFYIFIISKVLNTLIFTQLVVKKIFLSPNPRS